MTGQADQTIRFEMPSDPQLLSVVRAALEKLCRNVGFCEADTGAIVLSVDEAMTNIMRHAYAGATDEPIEAELTRLRNTGRGVRVRLRDYGACRLGEGFDRPDESKLDPDGEKLTEPGGLGLHIIRKTMDDVQFAPAEGDGTVLTMTKWLERPNQEDGA